MADGFDKVFAVSTTGFAEPARIDAQRLGIALRTVTDVGDIANDFEAMTLRVGPFNYGVRPLAPIEYDRRDPPAPRWEPPWNHLTIRLRRVGEPRFQDFATFVVSHTDHASVDLHGSEPVQFALRIPGRVEALVGRQHIVLSNPRLLVEAQKIEYAATILTARQYAESERIIAQDGEFGVEMPQGYVRYRVQVIDRANRERDIVWTREEAPPSMLPMPRTIITERYGPDG